MDEVLTFENVIPIRVGRLRQAVLKSAFEGRL
jgi:hypothetical protein